MGITNKEINNSDEFILKSSIKKPSLFEEIFNRYHDQFLRTAIKIIKDKEIAQDIIQEVFTKIYFNAQRFNENNGSFKSWGYKILLNTSFSYYQKLKKKKDNIFNIDKSFYENIGEFDEEGFKKPELRDYIISIFTRIPRQMSKILTLYYFEDLSQKVIAEQENLSISAVKTQIHRAKKEFKKVATELI